MWRAVAPGKSLVVVALWAIFRGCMWCGGVYGCARVALPAAVAMDATGDVVVAGRALTTGCASTAGYASTAGRTVVVDPPYAAVATGMTWAEVAVGTALAV
jgi:hypothetical protein